MKLAKHKNFKLQSSIIKRVQLYENVSLPLPHLVLSSKSGRCSTSDDRGKARMDLQRGLGDARTRIRVAQDELRELRVLGELVFLLCQRLRDAPCLALLRCVLSSFRPVALSP